MSSLAENTMPERHTFRQKQVRGKIVLKPKFLIRRNGDFLRRVNSIIFDFSFDSIVSKIDEGTINLLFIEKKPKYQKKYFWSDGKASQLVESILLRLPIPNCYFAENSEYRYDVIDGQQRLYSVYRYMNDKFSLTGLEVLPELNGCKFSELPSGQQEDMKLRLQSCVIIKNDSHPDVKFEVLKRLNSGSTPLTPHEIRNCIFRGKFNDLLGELAAEKLWLEIRNRSAPDGRMADEEIILRFFAFELMKRESYQPPFDCWLNDAAHAGNKINGKKLERLRNVWHETLEKTLEWFEPSECFRKPNDKRFNEVLFDLTTFTARKLDKDVVIRKKRKFRNSYRKLFDRPDFTELLNPSDDSMETVHIRLRLWKNAMSDLVV